MSVTFLISNLHVNDFLNDHCVWLMGGQSTPLYPKEGTPDINALTPLIIAKNTGQALSKIEKDVDRDFFMNVEEAKKYGIIDKVL